MGPLLLSRLLDLNDTQEGSLESLRQVDYSRESWADSVIGALYSKMRPVLPDRVVWLGKKLRVRINRG